MPNQEWQRTQPEFASDNVVLSGIDIPFWELVFFLVKLAIASIPAILILWVIMLVPVIFFWGLGTAW